MEYPKRRFQIFLRSPSAAIKVYLLSNEEVAAAAASQLLQQPSTPPSQQQTATGSGVACAADLEPRTPPSQSQLQKQGSEANYGDEETMQKLSPPAADPDFIYGMEPNEGITDLYESYELGQNAEAAGQRTLFD